MLAQQFIHTDYPILQLTDKAYKALELMESYDLRHWPLCADDKYVGLIYKDALLDVTDDAILGNLQNGLQSVAVKSTDFILTAVKQAAAHHLSLIPVVNEQNILEGILRSEDLLGILAHYIGVDMPGATLVLQMERKNYSFGEINRLVETNDAFITQLNSYFNNDTGLLEVAIKINKTEISDVVATFQRYEYAILYYFGEELYANEIKDNYDNLMAYLNV
ncbi:MAG: CBS domain-containing protein [Hydrotalea flava]|uniref:CBS domain-containing protein n=1 Tax=Hydrotalea TaxID=1004300 RepID=UPI00169F0F9D|nr:MULTISPECIES: CBS domain-containing protein [Hydrotalea]NIM33958.1 CBS domain-containing protein [Hydrotalea flava]NIM36787.1 CBS domain-containing protein [Hydrotalea flava]NIN01972.1 CBS domain-containing protein [Hydrotalea flava]NIN13631.1 CBS domain-containing protein [Hydrotalea flava]NIO92713.1 CBS domain-containing protein [Hydrotalea flava]